MYYPARSDSSNDDGNSKITTTKHIFATDIQQQSLSAHMGRMQGINRDTTKTSSMSVLFGREAVSNN